MPVPNPNEGLFPLSASPVPSSSPVESNSGGDSVLTQIKNKVSQGVKKVRQDYNEYWNSDSHPTANPTSAIKTSPKTVIKDEGSYKSLLDVQAHGYQHDKKFNDAIAARQIKIPSKAPTPALQMQAVAGKLNRIYNDPQYVALRPESRIMVKRELYRKYVVPALKANGIEPPSEDEWLAGYGSEKTREGGEKPTPTLFQEGLHSYGQSLGDLSKLTGNLIKYSLLGNAATLKYDSNSPESKSGIGKIISKAYKFADEMRQVDTDYSAAFNVRHDAAAWLTNLGGHLLGDAPAYIAAGELSSGIKIAEAVPTLAEKGAISNGAKVALAALKNAGEVFSVEKAESRDAKSAVEDAAGALILSPALHYGLQGLSKGIPVSKDKAIDVLRWGQAKLANGGEPFSNKVESIADELDAKEGIETPTMPNENTKALTNTNDVDVKQAAEFERYVREQLAREAHPEKASAAGDKSVWRNLSKGQREKIKTQLKAITQQSAELMPITSPEIQTQANSVEIARAAKEDPEFAKALLEFQQITGEDGAATLTKLQAKTKATELGLDNPAISYEEAFDEEYEPKEGEEASLGDGYTVSYLKRNDSLSPAKLSNASSTSADKFIHGTIKYLEDSPSTTSGKLYFENPQHHLLQIAVNSEAPMSVKRRAFSLLRDEFHLDKDQAITKAGWLRNHVEYLRDSGHLENEGNIFRSTKLTQARYHTKWQREVQEEINEADLDQLKKLTRNYPQLKKSLEALLPELNSIGYKSPKPDKALTRREAVKAFRDKLKEFN